jgi:tetratricopeptide (TPR) repeat protein
MERFLAITVLVAALAVPLPALSQDHAPSPPASNSQNQGENERGPQASDGTPQSSPPRSDSASSGESSSRDTKIPLETPSEDRGRAAGGNGPASDVRAMHPWDPHKADKAVEVGDFYFKRKNFAAAISRYREALYWKQDDAVALFRLGQGLEAVGQYAEARKQYGRYLQVLPHGSLAGDAQKALSRLKDKPDDPKKMETPVL